jgi:membrane-associated phospholipid phosphatase
MAGAVAGGLFLVNRRLGLIAAAAAAAMAVSAVYDGAHYPGDVAAGLILGAVVAMVGYAFLEDLLTHLVQRLATTRLRPLLTTALVTPPPPAAEVRPVPRPGGARGQTCKDQPGGGTGAP